MVVTEMVASDALARREQEAVLRSEGAGIVPHVVQLAGCDTRLLAEAARLSEGAGASVIDINMGCPAKRVVGGWAGSALMRDLDHAVSIIDAVIAAVAIPVTVKMRLGWDDGTRNASVLAKRAVGAGARMITVHGRTRCQFYKGRADWKAIRDVVEAVPAPVVANGDIGSVRDARACLNQSGARAVMIGRSALGKAWLPAAIQAAIVGGGDLARPSGPVRNEAAAEHYLGLMRLYGRSMGVRHARKHVAAYLDDACDGDRDRRAAFADALTSDDPDFVMGRMEAAFADAGPGLTARAA